MQALFGGPSSSQPSTQEPEPKGPLAKHLEQIIKNCEQAVNARDFSLPSPKTWDHFSASDLKASWSHSAIVSNAFNHVQGRNEFLETYKHLTEKWPEYHVQLTELDTHVRQKGTRADVYANAEVRGAPPGVVRTSVFVTEFAFDEEERRWVAIRMQGMSGIESSGQD
ncbi:hypothetical protein M409DRAFT_29155 [Zasmidium cellare ATCC 36951]|uniref:SnoaL-like domain-containing protein n=1 Tax=Zasmidium cellare ATCC 36951 TaxID=1080233 RepID=A0A6A6BZV2_ZASCE|nr:uncharacterized protein M409DRAFT_29155 [Zasmidium cellare ATCC 36951]KAF2160301.1 hypothetical protein M409DRAFT_29155 [Zasmidium cellare ATCC 36951]